MLDPDACYASLRRRDPAADGCFFAAVRTTHIYCRPICPARTPLRRNVSFYVSAAAAQANGYRPCLRCRPESAPDSPAWIGSLASVNRALGLIEEGALVDGGVEALAERLGMTARHLRRLFIEHLGVTPLAVEQTRRIDFAKQLIHETALPMTQIAFAAGYGSLRRFNEAFSALFDRSPSALRRQGGPTEAVSGVLRLRLSYRPPFDWAKRLKDLSEGDSLEDFTYRTVLPEWADVRIAVRPARDNALAVQIENAPIRDLARIVARIRRTVLVDATAAPVEFVGRRGAASIETRRADARDDDKGRAPSSSSSR